MYLRKSRAEENESVDATLSRHKDELTRYAAANGVTVSAVYEEIASGDSLYLRPQMLRLLDDLGKYDAILCIDIDRLGRGAMRDQGIIFEAIRDAGVLVITPGKTYDMTNDMDDSIIGFKALFAREEYKMIRGRLQRGLRKSAEEGCYLPGAPFGYQKIRIEKKPTLVIDEREAEGVRLIFDLYIEGKGCPSISETLYTAGYRPRRGERFSKRAINIIIRNPVYLGKVVWNQHTFIRPKRHGDKHVKHMNPHEKWIVTDGLHDAIISQEVFDEANKRLRGRYQPPYWKPNHLSNPLAGILFCAECGRSMLRVPHSDITKPNIVCPTSGCCMASNQDVVEEVFYSTLTSMLEVMTASDYQGRLSATRDGVSKNIKEELSRLNVQLSKIHEAYEHGVYDADTFLSRRDEINGRIQNAHEALSDVVREPDMETVIPRLSDVLARYWDGTPYERNQIIKSAVSRCVYRKPKGSGRNTLPVIEIVQWREL